MTADQFIASLRPKLRRGLTAEVLSEIEGWEAAMARWPEPTYSQADREMVKLAKLAILKGKSPDS
jgi:hypothetical protein